MGTFSSKPRRVNGSKPYCVSAPNTEIPLGAKRSDRTCGN